MADDDYNIDSYIDDAVNYGDQADEYMDYGYEEELLKDLHGEGPDDANANTGHQNGSPPPISTFPSPESPTSHNQERLPSRLAPEERSQYLPHYLRNIDPNSRTSRIASLFRTNRAISLTDALSLRKVVEALKVYQPPGPVEYSSQNSLSDASPIARGTIRAGQEGEAKKITFLPPTLQHDDYFQITTPSGELCFVKKLNSMSGNRTDPDISSTALMNGIHTGGRQVLQTNSDASTRTQNLLSVPIEVLMQEVQLERAKEQAFQDPQQRKDNDPLSILATPPPPVPPSSESPFSSSTPEIARRLDFVAESQDIASDITTVVAPANTSNSGPGSSLWVDKYTPNRVMDLLNADTTIRDVIRWIKLWDGPVFGRDSFPQITGVVEPRHTRAGTTGKKDSVQDALAKATRSIGADDPKAVDSLDKDGEREGEASASGTTGASPSGDTAGGKKKFPRTGFRYGFNPHQKILLLYGPPGTGKTTFAHTIARHCGYSTMEINASDDRTASVVTNRIETAQNTHTIRRDNKPVCLIFDEVDGMERDGVEALVALVRQTASPFETARKYSDKVRARMQGLLQGLDPALGTKRSQRGEDGEDHEIDSNAPGGESSDSNSDADFGKEDEDEEGKGSKKSNRSTSKRKGKGGKSKKQKNSGLIRPVICICNDLYAPSLRTLRTVAQTIEFTPAEPRKLQERLANIAKQEGLAISTRALNYLCTLTSNDIRSSLNTLQFLQYQVRKHWLERNASEAASKEDSLYDEDEEDDAKLVVNTGSAKNKQRILPGKRELSGSQAQLELVDVQRAAVGCRDQGTSVLDTWQFILSVPNLKQFERDETGRLLHTGNSRAQLLAERHRERDIGTFRQMEDLGLHPTGQGKLGETIRSAQSLFVETLLNTVGSHASDGRILMDGLLENYLSLGWIDTATDIHNVSGVLESLAYGDLMFTRVQRTQNYSLCTYLPLAALGVHFHAIAGKEPVRPRVRWPKNEMLVRSTRSSRHNIIASFQVALLPAMRGTRANLFRGSASTIVLDMLSPLLVLLNPDVTQLNPVLRSEDTKRALTQLAERLHSLGLNFVPSSNPTYIPRHKWNRAGDSTVPGSAGASSSLTSAATGRIYQALLQNTRTGRTQTSQGILGADYEYCPWDVEEGRSWVLQPELPQLVSFRADDLAGMYSGLKLPPNSPFFRENDTSTPPDLVVPTFVPLHDRIRQGVAQDVKALTIQSLIQRRKEEEEERKALLSSRAGNNPASIANAEGVPSGGEPMQPNSLLPNVSDILAKAGTSSLALPSHVTSQLGHQSAQSMPATVDASSASTMAQPADTKPAGEECFLSRAAAKFRDSDMDRRRQAVQRVSQKHMLESKSKLKDKLNNDSSTATVPSDPAQPIPRTFLFGVKYTYQEGFSNAVRRPVQLKDFI